MLKLYRFVNYITLIAHYVITWIYILSSSWDSIVIVMAVMEIKQEWKTSCSKFTICSQNKQIARMLMSVANEFLQVSWNNDAL